MLWCTYIPGWGKLWWWHIWYRWERHWSGSWWSRWYTDWRFKASWSWPLTDNEVPKATNKEDGGQTSKSTDKKPIWKCRNGASSRSPDCPVCYDRDILADGQKDKYPKDHISIHCIQRAGRVLLMSCRVVSGQVYLGTQTHQKLELPFAIYLGSSKFAKDSFQESVPYRTFCIWADCILPTIWTFREQVI